MEREDWEREREKRRQADTKEIERDREIIRIPLSLSRKLFQ